MFCLCFHLFIFSAKLMYSASHKKCSIEGGGEAALLQWHERIFGSHDIALSKIQFL